jgi:hypothetical protein
LNAFVIIPRIFSFLQLKEGKSTVHENTIAALEDIHKRLKRICASSFVIVLEAFWIWKEVIWCPLQIL